MLTRVVVTDKDISKGIPGSYRNSPVSLAMSRAIGRSISTSPLEVGGFAWDYDDPGWQIDLPQFVASKIIRHDQGGGMVPFEFEVWVPELAGVSS